MQEKDKEKDQHPRFPIVAILKECGRCKRKILVERALFGVNHTFEINVVCWECLNKQEEEKVKKKYKLEEK